MTPPIMADRTSSIKERGNILLFEENSDNAIVTPARAPTVIHCPDYFRLYLNNILDGMDM